MAHPGLYRSRAKAMLPSPPTENVMQSNRFRPLAATPFLLALFLSTPLTHGHAGQVHVRVSNNLFTPASVSLNRGDQVVWVWDQGNHTVTSGEAKTATPDGNFDSGGLLYNATNGTAFSYKAPAVVEQNYYCEFHIPGMEAELLIGETGALVADFRITEIQFNAAGGADLIEITNLGDVQGDLGRYRLVTSTGVATLPVNTLPVGANAQVVVHLNATGTNNAANVFLPSTPELGNIGSAALFVPYTKSGSTLADSTFHLVDFVQWGAGNQRTQTVAALAFVGGSMSQTFWTPGQFVTGAATGHSIAFCGTRGQYGNSTWSEISTPNLGTGLSCTTPATSTSWGTLKILYR